MANPKLRQGELDENALDRLFTGGFCIFTKNGLMMDKGRMVITLRVDSMVTLPVLKRLVNQFSYAQNQSVGLKTFHCHGGKVCEQFRLKLLVTPDW